MNKEEFLSFSLPHKLRLIFEKSGKIIELQGLRIIDTGSLIYNYGDLYYDSEIWNFKPILHPLSDLTKEIEHNGEKFVPNIKLENEFDIEDFDTYLEYLVSREDDGNVYISIEKQLNIILKLIEWHFDISGLIEKGEAIDINTLQDNPYK